MLVVEGCREMNDTSYILRGQRRLALLASMVPVMGQVCESRLKRWKYLSTADTSVNFVESMQ